MSLREDLAQRLRESALLTVQLDMPDVWKRVADECIRQMEWARLLPWGDLKEVELPDGGTQLLPSAELTLAPPDWKP